ncbi:MAG: hypothetical protein SFV54_05795 [Bryobacteraceae bacterium]|nr:hypothetical protein [Bryobacteraceae bacterium]
MDHLSVPGLHAEVQKILDFFPGFLRHQRLVATLVAHAFPVELATVDSVAKYNVKAADVDLSRSERQFFRPNLLRESLERVIASFEPFKDLLDCGSLNWVRGDGSPAVSALDVLVAHRGDARPDAALGLLSHPLAGFFAEVLDVVLGHQDFDAVKKLFRRA